MPKIRVLEEKIGDDLTLTCVRHTTMRGLVLKGHIIKVAGPALASALPVLEVLRNEKGELDIAKADLKTVLPALKPALEAITPEALPGLVREMLAGTTAVFRGPKGLEQLELGGHPAQADAAIERVFGERDDMDLILACWLSVRVNASFFVDAAMSVAASVQSPSAAPSP